MRDRRLLRVAGRAVLGAAFALFGACQSFVAPPEPSMVGLTSGALSDPAAPLVVRFSKAIDPRTLSLQIVKFDPDAHGQLPYEGLDAGGGNAPFFTHAYGRPDTGGTGTLDPTHTVFTITLDARLPVGPELALLVAPGLSDATPRRHRHDRGDEARAVLLRLHLLGRGDQAPRLGRLLLLAQRGGAGRHADQGLRRRRPRPRHGQVRRPVHPRLAHHRSCALLPGVHDGGRMRDAAGALDVRRAVDARGRSVRVAGLLRQRHAPGRLQLHGRRVRGRRGRRHHDRRDAAGEHARPAARRVGGRADGPGVVLQGGATGSVTATGSCAGDDIVFGSAPLGKGSGTVQAALVPAAMAPKVPAPPPGGDF